MQRQTQGRCAATPFAATFLRFSNKSRAAYCPLLRLRRFSLTCGAPGVESLDSPQLSMSIRLRRRCWFALANALVASDALPSSAVAQTIVRLRISDSAIANGSTGGCRTAVFTAPASAAHDTIRIEVYSAADTTKRAKAGTQLLVLLGVTEIAAIAAGDTGIVLPRAVGDVSGANIFLIRADSRSPLCTSGINPPLTRVIRDSVLRRPVEVDSGHSTPHASGSDFAAAALSRCHSSSRLRGTSPKTNSSTSV